jgi:hypothetical protein
MNKENNATALEAVDEKNATVLEAVDKVFDFAMALSEDLERDEIFDESDRVAFLELLVVKLEEANS